MLSEDPSLDLRRLLPRLDARLPAARHGQCRLRRRPRDHRRAERAARRDPAPGARWRPRCRCAPASIPQAEPGHAILRIADLDASPDGLTISIQRQQGPDSHLADDGWRRTEAWLQPEQVVRIKGALEFHLGPEICDRLAGIATIRLRVKEPDIGVVGTTVVAWPQMLTSGAVDLSSRSHDDTVRLRGRAARTAAAAPPAPPFEPPPASPAAPMPELRAEREPLPPIEPERRPRPVDDRGGDRAAARRRRLLRLHQLHPAARRSRPRRADVRPAPRGRYAAAAAPTPVAPKKSVRETVAEYLATNPTPEAMLAKGQGVRAGRRDERGLPGVAPRRRGRQPAGAGRARVVLRSAQPRRPRRGFTPDGARAADWYERAALAGNAEAQRKFGLLLAKGGAGLPADQGRAKRGCSRPPRRTTPRPRRRWRRLPK